MQAQCNLAQCRPSHWSNKTPGCPARHPYRTVIRPQAVQQQQTTRANADLMSLVPWAIKNGLTFAKIKPAVLPGSGRGLICLSDIQPGECVCNVPVSAAIRVYPGCPTVLQIPDKTWQQLPWYGQLSLTLLDEQSKGAASKWADYIRQLPAAVDAPVLWEEPEVQQLQCAYFIEQVQQQQQDWAALQQQVAPYLASAGLSAEQLSWALSITRSRTFAAPYSSNPFGAQLGWLNKQAGQQQQQQHVMCPLLDLFNHREDVQSECEFYSGLRSSSFRVVASQAWARNSEVFINYGGGSNDALLQLYDFVEPGNKEDRYIVRCLPSILAQQGIATTTAADTSLGEVVFTRQGLDAAAAALLSRLVSEPGSSQSSGTVPYSALSRKVQGVCAAAVQQEVSTLAVDADADREVVQAFSDLPVKQSEVESKQADLSKAQARLQQLQRMLQDTQHNHVDQQSHQEPEDAASADAAASMRSELVSMIELCEQLCERLAADLDGLQALVARWQGLVQHKQLAVMYRLEKHLLLTGALQQLQEGV